jgi:hypothetical protein
LRWGNTQLPLLESCGYHITSGVFCQGVCKRDSSDEWIGLELAFGVHNLGLQR